MMIINIIGHTVFLANILACYCNLLVKECTTECCTGLPEKNLSFLTLRLKWGIFCFLKKSIDIELSNEMYNCYC